MGANFPSRRLFNSLSTVKMPWKNSDNTDANASAPSAADAPAAEQSAAQDKPLPKGYTPKKGRPTPKRADVERAQGTLKGPVSAPLTRKEAKAKRKEMESSMSKAEIKAAKIREKSAKKQARQEAEKRMMEGDERYLLERDRGAERRYIRDWIDSRRFINNLFMPFALVLLLTLIIGQAWPQVAAILSSITMVVLVVIFIEGVVLARRANKAVRAKFPDTKERIGFGTGFYAYQRAAQLRRLRAPRPQVEVGANV